MHDRTFTPIFCTHLFHAEKQGGAKRLQSREDSVARAKLRDFYMVIFVKQFSLNFSGTAQVP